METLIEVKNISKSYKKIKVLDNLSFTLQRGEIMGLIGENGAGKSTLLKIITGLVKANSGDVLLPSPQLAMGSLIESGGYYGNLSALEHLRSLTKLYGESQFEMAELLALTGLTVAQHKKVKHYSLGMKQRLGIAMALYNTPQVIILDEPNNGLDPFGVAELRALILQINEAHGIAFIISSHNLDELAKLATSLAILKNGRLLCHSEKNELLKNEQNLEDVYFQIMREQA